MTKRKALAALAAGLIIGVGGWVLSRTSGPGRNTGGPKTNAWDTTHEKVFLAEQLDRNPTHAPILLRLSQIERSDGNLGGARGYLEQAVAADGRQVDLRLELGLVDSEMNDLAAAEAQNRAVLQIDPSQPDALYNLGAIAANRGNLVEARQFWSDAMRVGGNSDSGVRARKALESLGEFR